MNRDDLRIMGNSLINLGEAMQRNEEALVNMANIGNRLERMENDIRNMRHELRNINNNMVALTQEVRLNDRRSIGRTVNSHNLNADSVIFWLPVIFELLHSYKRKKYLINILIKNGVRPRNFPRTVQDLENSQRQELNAILNHYGLHGLGLVRLRKLLILRRYLGLP